MHPTLQSLFGAGSNALSSSGRNGDSMMAHLSPSAAATLKRAGGSGSVNPETGMREYFNAQWYLQQNPDVAADPYFSQNPEAHWQAFGQGEGRASDPPGAVALTNNQLEQYFGGQSDIQAARAADPNFNLAQWYQTYGQNEVANGSRQMTATPAATPAATSRYAAPTDIQGLWDLMTPQQQQNAVKQAGWSGGIDDSLNQWVASGNQNAFESAVRANRYSAPTAVQQRFDAMTPQMRDAALAGAGWTGGSSNPDLNQWALNNKSTFENAIMNFGKSTPSPGISYDTLGSALTNLNRYFSTMNSSNPFGSLSSLYGSSSPFFQQSGSFGSGAGGNFLSSLFGAGSSGGSLFGGSATSGGASSTSPSANPFGSSSGAFAKSSRSMFPTQTGLI